MSLKIILQHTLFSTSMHQSMGPCAEETPGSASAQTASVQRGEKRRWANLRHVNGVAVYQEHAEQSGAGGAFMVSAVVRATPKACFKVGPCPSKDTCFLWSFRLTGAWLCAAAELSCMLHWVK